LLDSTTSKDLQKPSENSEGFCFLITPDIF